MVGTKLFIINSAGDMSPASPANLTPLASGQVMGWGENCKKNCFDEHSVLMTILTSARSQNVTMISKKYLAKLELLPCLLIVKMTML